MSEYFHAPLWQCLKTVIYKTESGKYFSIVIRGDLDVNEIKVRKFIAKKYGEGFTQATEEDLIALGTVRGFATPIRDAGLKIENYGDESLMSAKNYFGGANALAKSTKNVNIGDLDIVEFADFNEPILGFTSKNVPGELLTFRNACEVGNIFHLGEKYSKPFGLSFSDENNQTVNRVEMGCYGIWVSRLMGVLAEYFMTENGIAWPESVAPADYYIIVVGEDNIPAATELAVSLEQSGKTVILDDRMGSKYGFGQKAADCDLWWIPNRIVLSPKTLEKWGYELKKRTEIEGKIITL
jgi:prolyl-tRNA synthetase